MFLFFNKRPLLLFKKMRACLLIYKPITEKKFSELLIKLSTVFNESDLEILCIPWNELNFKKTKTLESIANRYGFRVGYIPTKPYNQKDKYLPIESCSTAFETIAANGNAEIRILQEDVETLIKSSNITYAELKAISRNYDFPLVMGKNNQLHFPFMWTVMYAIPPEETKKKSTDESLCSAATRLSRVESR